MHDDDHDTQSPDLKIGALFAGYGGLDLAVESVFGARTVWVSEFDSAPSTILAHRFPDAPNHGDVTAIDWTAVEPVDIITGGSPCQDLSHAGKRAGMKSGTRSGLWAAMCDAIETIRPGFVVWENVRGAFSAEADSAVEHCPFCLGDERRCTLRALGRVLGDLAELGYDASWCGVRASDVGAPHARFRVFVLAWPARDAASLDAERGWEFEQLAYRYPARGAGGDIGSRGSDGSGHGRRDGGAARNSGGGTAADVPDAARVESDEQLRQARAQDAGDGAPTRYAGGGVDVPLFPTPRATRGGSSSEIRDMLPTPRAQNGNPRNQTIYTRPDGDPQNLENALARLDLDDEPDEDRLLPTPAASLVWETMTPERWDEWRETERRAAGIGTSRQLSVESQRLSTVDFGPYEAAVRRWESLLGRPVPDPTEPHPGRENKRRLSPPFVEWMMGLPEGWVTDVPISRDDQLKALGNGVVPQQAAAALVHLLDVRELVYAPPSPVVFTTDTPDGAGIVETRTLAGEGLPW